ncbi:hypothetical protein ACFQ1Q_12320 [Winogradskyella litorisediminis]|uniref:Tetratricopeptide repeat protein n=1 Tax=Winogradskyella litorisediminis TaxID=1156618 RepID=A0ABW3N9M2_9FLAO
MKIKIYLLAFLLSVMVTTSAQQNSQYLLLGAHVPEQAENIPGISKRMLINKLGKIITENGISDDVTNSRFILVPNVTVLTKDVLPTAPPRVALNLDMTLYIGDGEGGNLFASESFELKGVGSNYNKAFVMALRQLKPKNPRITAFIEKGKTKIIDYYNNNCSVIIKKADQAARVNDFEEAVAILGNVPAESTCVDKTIRPLKTYFASYIDFDCKQKLNLARNIWSANQNIESANEAARLLINVNPNAACFNDVRTLFREISKRSKELSDRPWEYKLMELDVQRSQVEAARDIALERARNFPNTLSYNIGRWF